MEIVANLSLLATQTDEYDSETIPTTRTSVGVGARFWALPRFWLEGGLGRAILTSRSDYGYAYRTESLLTFYGALGYELKHTAKFAIDVQIRAGAESYDGTSFAANT